MNDTKQLPGVNVMFLGDSGAGKTHSIGTMVNKLERVFVLFTEPGMEVLAGQNSCADGLHWHYVPPAVTSWETLQDNAKKINTLSFQALAEIKGGMNKQEYGQFLEVLQVCNDFTCQRCGESFGAVDSWGNEDGFVIDSLSGLSDMAMDLTVGAKPTKSMGEWGVAMDNLERFLKKCCTDTTCHFALTAHIERETNEITGGLTTMASTLGKKLAPKLPRNFSDVVLCVRDGDKFRWSTAEMQTALKARNLPISEKIQPNFDQIFMTWKSKVV